MLAVHRAVLALRQHSEHARLGESAVQRAVRLVLAAAAERPMVLQIDRRAVHLAGEPVLHHQPGEVPFGALAGAGIGEVVVRSDVTELGLRSLLRLLGAAVTGERTGADLVAALRQATPAGIVLRAASVTGERSGAVDHCWLTLPPPDPRFHGLQAAIERDRDANLPALAAARLLAFLEQVPPGGDRRADLLDGLFAAMLQRGDAASAAWLLEQCEHHERVPPAIVILLRQRALAAWHGPWLGQQLTGGTAPDPHGLVALAITLGDRALRHLADVADATATDLPFELRAMLPTPP